MQRINQSYTQYFNKKYGKVGHLFQGRYKSLLCNRDEYLLSLVRYIHLNPVRAKLVKSPREFKWSSHLDYLSGTRDLVDSRSILEMFSAKANQARKMYEKFVMESLGEGKNESYYQAPNQQILGDNEFVGTIEKKLKAKHRSMRKPSFEDVLRGVEQVTGVSQEKILSRLRQKEIMRAKGVLAGVWREFGCRLVDLQPKMKRDLSVLSRLTKISEQGEDKKISEKVIALINARLQA
jgi:putative transposase